MATSATKGAARPELTRRETSRPRHISADCEPRTLWVPRQTLERIERGHPPGEFITRVTLLLTDWLHAQEGGAE